MINDQTNGYLDQVKQFAERTGQLDQLKDKLLYLGRYACNDGRVTRCNLMKDFAPKSFYFVMDLKQEGEPDSAFKTWFNGGLIFYDAGDTGVGAPQFSVRLDASKSGWNIHT